MSSRSNAGAHKTQRPQQRSLGQALCGTGSGRDDVRNRPSVWCVALADRC
jgi:hypothetical protein